MHKAKLLVRIRSATLILIIIVVSFNSINVSAGSISPLSQADVNSITNNNPFYDPTDIAQSCSGGQVGTPGGPIAGDLKALAQQIITNPSITYDYGPNGITALQFKRIANGEQAQTDNGLKVDVQPIILVVVLRLAQSHKVNVSALTDGGSHANANNPHGSGQAVDISQLDATHTNGTDALATTITSIAAAVLPNNSRFGLGANGGSPVGSTQIAGKTFVTFVDNTNHVHIDVKGVSQAADDAAVIAAGVGGTTSTTAASPSCCPTADNSGSTTLTGKTPGEQVFNYFISKGLSNDSAAAATGNLELESSFVTNEWAGNGHYGLAQWDRAYRYPQLLKFAGSIDKASRIEYQLDFIYHELNHGYTSTLQNLKGSSSVTDKAIFWGRHYEGAVNPDGTLQAEKQRVAFALKWASKAGGVPAGAGQTVSATSATDCASSSSAPGQYANPFHSTDGLLASRIDEGVDYASTKPVPMYAIGNAVVTVATTKSTFFTTRGGHSDWITYQLSDGPAAGKYIYVSEACPPLVKVGDIISTSTHICDVLPDSTEMGWAPNATGQYAAAYPDYSGHDGYETAYGVNFNQLLVKLGAPSGHLDSGSDPSGKILGTLPTGWPTW